ncbi:phage tail sheath family protein [Paraliomyxa miuraensis]|uniref:phage tail sheath family protein n=1 Tax=Paraliomyxa miuraensis TaxID=376150 RepID=UPI0022520DA1|nr:phage tail sheath subtilisin-like domain-containing protein [Paraliomyxa miuraensis]MCX4245545.1 phage tail sheath subtilisin-like domain-containing protein [Paraliomyxa miuraensis]
MVQVSYPGVYAVEVPSGVRSISGVSTSIAVFVGMTKRGRVFEPRRVLGFKGYEDVYSADTSLGETTDQVRQFFLNGGEEAIIVRVAHGAQSSTLPLTNEAGATVMTVSARDEGDQGRELRVRVDYDTASPERTFNLTVFRETFDAAGLPVVEQTEVFTELGIDPVGPRYVQTIVNQQSQLATVAVDTTAVNAAATMAAYSASARLFVNAAAAEAAIVSAIGSGSAGAFTVRVGSSPIVTVQLDPAGLDLNAVQTAINTRLAGHTPITVAVSHPTPNGPLRFTASAAGHDVLLGPASTLDIARTLGLGTEQGGIEVGSHAAARPAASGLVSRLHGAAAGDLVALLNFGTATKADLDAVGVTVDHPFTVPTASIGYPSSTGTMTAGTRSATPSLANVQENLEAIAAALSAASSDWTATVHGHRLVLRAVYGTASAGTGAGFTSSDPSLTAANQIYASVTGGPSAGSLTGGTDGSAPELADYATAYDRIDQEVDLFNLLVLPHSAADTAVPSTRSTLWGPASSFCVSRRAVLLVDPEPVQATTDAMLNEIKNLRVGVAKDHAAVYWPRVTISSGGVRKNVDASGSISGLMARIDGSRGVWKAPAGLEGDLRGVLGVETALSDKQNGLLNPQAINVLRSFPNGIVSWGARTMDGFDNSGNNDYRYLPPRRLALFIEESLVRGLRFAVFEPNDEPLWAQIRLAAGAFMNGLFRRGAFAGKTASTAYAVKADSETTTQADIDRGIVNVLILFAPVKPAEFIVIRLQQKAGQVQV